MHALGAVDPQDRREGVHIQPHTGQPAAQLSAGLTPNLRFDPGHAYRREPFFSHPVHEPRTKLRRVGLAVGHRRHPGSEEEPRVQHGIELVVRNLQDCPDHRTHREVELGDLAPDLDHLPVGEPLDLLPLGLLPPGVLQPHRYAVAAGVHIGCRREREHHSYERTGPRFDEDAADEAREALVARLHLDFVHRDRPGQRGRADPDRIGDPKAVGILALATERMRYVAHVAAFADRDAVPETVLDRGEPVDVVPEVLYRQEFLAPQRANGLAGPPVGAPVEVHGDLVDAHGHGLAAVVAIQVEIDVTLGARLVGHRRGPRPGRLA